MHKYYPPSPYACPYRRVPDLRPSGGNQLKRPLGAGTGERERECVRKVRLAGREHQTQRART